MNPRHVLGLLGRNPDNWLLAILGLISLIFLIQTFEYPAAAALLPRGVCVVVGALCLYLLAGNIYKAFAGQSVQKGRREAGMAGLPWRWSLLAMIGYVILIYLIGLLLATAIYLLIFPIMMRYRRWGLILASMGIMLLAIQLGFVMFLHISVPAGLIGGLLGQ